MAVPDAGTANLSLRSIRDEISNNNYGGSATFSNISLEDLCDGTVATINTGNNAANRPDGSAPHQMSEFYSYDHDFSTSPVVPTLSYSTSDINSVSLTWDMAGGNTKVYFKLVSSTLGHADIIAGDYDDTDLEINGEAFQTSAGTADLLDGNHSVDDDNENIGTGNFPNESITVKARGRAADNSYSSYTSNFQAFTKPGPVTSLRDIATTTSTLTFGWATPAGGVRSIDGYRFYFGTNSDHFSNSSTLGAGSLTSKQYTSLIMNTTYYLGVETIGDNGDVGKASDRATTSGTTSGFGSSDRRLKTNIKLITITNINDVD